MLTAVLLLGVAAAPPARTNAAAERVIRADSIRAHVRFLASDLLEGRGPGTRGDALAEAYIASQLEALGLKPAGTQGFLQPFDIVGVDGHAATVQFTHGSAVARPPPRRGRHRGGRRRRGAHRDRGGGAGLRGLRHPRARVRLGRLQGAGPPGQGAPHPQQRPRGRPGALRRQDPALVRPLGLQVRDGGEGRGRGRDHPPHPAQRRLPVAGGADLLVRAPVLAPVLRAEGADARVDHRGGLPAAPGAPGHHPRGAGARGRPPRLPSRPAGHRGHRRLRQPGRADADGERARAAPGQRPPALVRGGALHRPPRPPRDAHRRARRARTPSTTGPRTTPRGWP